MAVLGPPRSGRPDDDPRPAPAGRLFAVVPVKALGAAKSRLESALTRAERAGLVADLLRGELQALRESAVVAATAVVSPDPEALAIAATAGATGLCQAGSGLNEALEQGRAWALAGGADRLLVLLGDLPWLEAEDIRALAGLADGGHPDAPRVVLAPDRHGHGTNALLARPPGALPFHFGLDSYGRHVRAAAAAGAEVAVYRASGTAFDLDTPRDLAEWRARGLPAVERPAS